MTLGAGEVAAVHREYIGWGGDAGCRRLQPVLSPDRERAGYGLPSGNAVPDLEATREGARQDGKGRMPGVVWGPLYVRQKFFEPPGLFLDPSQQPLPFVPARHNMLLSELWYLMLCIHYPLYFSHLLMDTARAADVTKNGIQSIGCGGGSMDSALPPHEGSPLNSSGLSFFWLSYHPR